MNNTFSSEKLYSLQEVAKMLRVSERSVFRYIHGGKLRATKIGYWRISGADLGKFLAENQNVYKAVSKKDFMSKVEIVKKKKKTR
jgi:excisionase family DNA binding protein